MKKLTDDEVLTSTKRAVAAERAGTVQVLDHLREIERRMLYAKLGYSSLFEYGLKELGYSEAEIHVRISAMRLVRDIPESRHSIEKGKLSLTNAAMARSYFKKNLAADKREVLLKLENKSKREAEEILGEKKLTVVLPERILNKMEKLRESLGDISYVELIEFALDNTKVKKSVRPAKVKRPARVDSRYVPADIKREVRKRDEGQCTYISPISQRRCGAKHRLQYDHIQPYSQGGAHTASNLRLRCAAHNALSALETFGDEFRDFRPSLAG